VFTYVVDLIFLWDYFTTRGALSYLTTSIGAQAQTIYNIVVFVALALAFCVPFYFGYKFRSWRDKTHHGLEKIREETENEPTKLGTVNSEQKGLDLCREEDRPKIEALLNEAERHSTIWVLGIDCSDWLDDYRPKVKEYVTGHDHDLSIIFLVAKPDSVILEKAIEAKIASPGAKGRIEVSIALFQEMKSELREKGGKVQLGIYELPLVHSMVVVNPNTGVERIQVTPYLHKTDWADIPNLTLRKHLLTKAQQAVFDAYHDSIKRVLENAKDLDGKPLVVV
jgi:hypothetical protein